MTYNNVAVSIHEAYDLVMQDHTTFHRLQATPEEVQSLSQFAMRQRFVELKSLANILESPLTNDLDVRSLSSDVGCKCSPKVRN
jgi:hypothetical protein